MVLAKDKANCLMWQMVVGEEKHCDECCDFAPPKKGKKK